ncbi:hypothetical protein C8Q70DRAFT_265614 [Cubamyces menziesii]|nr:hypothetical protein C8Q70DRAFT_265614 [Cubamyces menziesii]
MPIMTESLFWLFCCVLSAGFLLLPLLCFASTLPSERLYRVDALFRDVAHRLNDGARLGQIPSAHAEVLDLWLGRIGMHIGEITIRVHSARTLGQGLRECWSGCVRELEEIRKELRYYQRILNMY